MSSLRLSLNVRGRAPSGSGFFPVNLLKTDRHRGRGCPRTPATPPDMRVRIRRFEKLRSCEPRNTEAIEVRHIQNMMHVRETASPPTTCSRRHLQSQLLGCPKAAKTPIGRGACPPVSELDGAKPTTQPLLQHSESPRCLGQPEVSLPTWHVFPELFSHLVHAATAGAASDESYTLPKRVKRFGGYSNLDRVTRRPP